MESVFEAALRTRLMAALNDRVADRGYLTRAELSSFELDGGAYRLIDHSRGIWNPSWLEATLSVVSSPDGPYDDQAIDGALFRYDYRAGTIDGDNRKLRRAYELQVPIILLRKIQAGYYAPIFPVYVVGDDPRSRQFMLALDEGLRLLSDLAAVPETGRHYAETVVRRRLHQPEFRARILLAYRNRCSICDLKRGRLLDAAHIIADSDDDGDPIVQNGMSLCKIHHAAYDANLLGISPDFIVRINDELLHESDGPMLRHGIQEMDGHLIALPDRLTQHPDRARLAQRFSKFRAAG